MLERLKTDRRLGLYLAGLALLTLLCGTAVWSTARTGAWLTDEGDWQYLGGDYRIGTIDYTVYVNGQRLLGLTPGSADPETYELAVPLPGGVRTFDPTLEGTAAERAKLRTAEFNAGAVLARVRIFNRSDSMVEVSTAFSLDAGATDPALRCLPLPVTLDQAGAERLDYRKFVLDTLGLTDPADFTAGPAEADALSGLDSAYAYYLQTNSPYRMDVGIIPGVTDTDPGADRAIGATDDKGRTSYYFYKDVFLLFWSEYGRYQDGDYQAAEYNAANQPSAPVRQGRLLATFTVGQVE